MKWVNNLAYSIRRLKLISILSLIFTFSMTYEFLSWVMTSDPTELGEALAVTGIMTTLVALVKFIFEFYMKEPRDDNK
jgi:hypothetical protein